MKFLLSAVALLFSVAAFSQDLQLCGSPQKEKEARENNPQILIDEAKLKQFVHDWIASNADNLRDAPDYIIPVVFHVVHDYGSENISDDQVRDAVRILNEDYRKLNADTSTIVPSFISIATDAKIEFRLANKTSTGLCTTGIDHVHSLLTYSGGDGAKLDDWPRDKYLNIWTVKQFTSDMAGVVAYAYLPATVASSGSAPFDGVIVLSNFVGSIGTSTYVDGRTVTHEIGHTLGLSHPWGDNNNPGVVCGDDDIFDTPETKGWTTCNLTGSVCNPPVIENVQNYMDYSFCSRMFTAGQVDVMHGTLNSTICSRNNLWTTANLNATGTNDTIEPLCVPHPDFYSNYNLTCVGSSILFHDVSWGGAGTSRSWTFQDGNPATSTVIAPSVSFTSPGWKTVTLSVTNAEGTITDTQDKFVFISDNSNAQYAPGYWESFVDLSQFNNDWIVVNREGNSSLFKRVTNAGYNSSECVELNEYLNTTIGDIDDLISPSFNLASGGPLYLNFRYTCASHTSVQANINDALTIWSSTNCGQSWSLRYTIQDNDLANVGYKSASYVPNSTSPWVGKSIVIPSSILQPNVRFKFEYKTNGKGNNFYLDDVQVNSYPVGIHDPAAASFALNVFPNPLTDNSVVVINRQVSGNLDVRIADITGRTVRVLNNGWLSEGEHNFSLKASDLGTSGMYFIIADDGITVSREKIVVQ